MKARSIQTLLRKAYRSIRAPKRPKRMFMRGRPAMDTFEPDESLYRRFRQADIVNGQIVAASLQFPKTGEDTGQSFNRSTFSQAEDVLWHDNSEERYEGWGFLEFPVSCLPAEEICPNTHNRYTFFPKHVPLEKNYAHSEVWCDTLPRSNDRYVRPSASVRKALRAIISQEIRIVRPAEL